MKLHLNIVHKRGSKGRPKNSTNNINQLSFRFGCAICNDRFKYKKGLTAHIKLVHQNSEVPSSPKSLLKPSAFSKKPWFTCEICNEEFKYKRILREHQRSVHSIPNGIFPKYRCEPCNKQFWKQSSFATHNRTKHKSRALKQRITDLKKQKILRLEFEKSQRLKRLEENGEETSGTVSGGNMKVGRRPTKKLEVESTAVNINPELSDNNVKN